MKRLLQRNSTKCILFEIDNIYTIYKLAEMFLMCLKSLVPYLIEKNPVLDLSLIKDLNPCLQDAFVLMGHGK